MTYRTWSIFKPIYSAVRKGAPRPRPARRWLLLPALVALASCEAPPPSAPELVDRYWTTATPTSSPTLGERATPATLRAPAPGTTWTLEGILARIRQANPDLATARARVAAAEAARAEAASFYLPTLTASQSYQRTDNPGTAFGFLLDQQKLTLGPGFDPTPGSIDNWRTEVRVDLELFTPGRSERVHAAQARARAANLTRTAIERRLLNAGVQAWHGLRAALALQQVKDRAIAVVDERLTQTRQRQQAGAALEVDVLCLQVRLAEAKQNAQQAALAVRQAQSQLQALMGMHGDDRIVLADEPMPTASPLPEQLEAAIAHARSHRLDVLASAETLRSQDWSARAARAAWLPRLLAYGAYDIDGSDLGFDLDLDSYLAGVGFEWRFSGQTAPRLRQARAAEQQARAELLATATAVTREVADALAALDVARRSAELAHAATGAAAEAYRLVAAAQDAGGATVTDVLEAENARDDAEARAVVADAAVAIAHARLAAAVGEVR